MFRRFQKPKEGGAPKEAGDGREAPRRAAVRSPEACDRVGDTEQWGPVPGLRRGDRGGVRGGALLLPLLPGEPGRCRRRQAAVRDHPEGPPKAAAEEGASLP